MFDIFTCLSFSGFMNTFIGLKLALSFPSSHLQLQRHPRYDYISYVFAGHGFLVFMLGISELYSVFFISNPIVRNIICTYIARLIACGDCYVLTNAIFYKFIKKSEIHPSEIEFSYFSMIYCVIEASSLLYFSYILE